MKLNSKGTPIILVGVLLIAAALGLVASNLADARAAGESARETMSSIATMIPPAPTSAPNTAATPEPPLYKIDPNVSMPEKSVGGIAYIGYLSIPALELELPVITRTTDYYLTVAPCRFSGTAYLENLVIGAHNYNSHFGRLKELTYGDEITFTDMDGNLFCYEVANIETLNPDQDEYLRAGEYPLSLYTCTIGGRTRLTIRCISIE